MTPARTSRSSQAGAGHDNIAPGPRPPSTDIHRFNTATPATPTARLRALPSAASLNCANVSTYCRPVSSRRQPPEGARAGASSWHGAPLMQLGRHDLVTIGCGRIFPRSPCRQYKVQYGLRGQNDNIGYTIRTHRRTRSAICARCRPPPRTVWRKADSQCLVTLPVSPLHRTPSTSIAVRRSSAGHASPPTRFFITLRRAAALIKARQRALVECLKGPARCSGVTRRVRA